MRSDETYREVFEAIDGAQEAVKKYNSVILESRSIIDDIETDLLFNRCHSFSRKLTKNSTLHFNDQGFSVEIVKPKHTKLTYQLLSVNEISDNYIANMIDLFANERM